MKRFILPFALFFFTSCAFSLPGKDNPEELGTINWLRDYDEALAEAKNHEKPVLVLFQEVPGCSTCRNYGHNVLSHPLLAEAIEQYFVPLAIYNNKGGADAAVLKKYGEPSWNNPVVRIVDDGGNDLAERLSGNYSLEGLYRQMEVVLAQKGVEPDPYFELLGDEISMKNGKTETAVFSMYCFWSGEGHLGARDGVLATKPGFQGGREVVKVEYDPTVMSKGELEKYAAKASCSKMNGDGSFRSDKDPQYYLKQTAYKYLPLSCVQRTKINSALANNGDASRFLSPKQRAWLDEMGNKKSSGKAVYHLPLREAWAMKTGGSRN